MASIAHDIHALDDPFYRSSDGKPMADNETQWQWMVAIKGGLEAQYAAVPDVLVVGDMLWYPVRGNNTIRSAPDALVIFGRPKGVRGSYIQHREEGVAPQVAFEALSPGNRAGEKRRKLAWYERYGIQEYYVLDPDHGRHKGYLRSATGTLEPIAKLFGWTSPRLGIRFELNHELRIIGADGRPFLLLLDVHLGRNAAEQHAAAAEEHAADLDRQLQAAEEHAADLARQRQAVDQDNDRLRAKLRALGIDPDA